MKTLAKALLALALTMPAFAVVSPVDASNGLPCPKYHKLMQKHGLPVKHFAWIMARESKCVTRAVGWNYYKGKDHTNCRSGKFHAHKKCAAVKSWDVGLLQINSQHDRIVRQQCGAGTRSFVLTQPECNLKVAKVLYDLAGLAAWAGTSH